MTPKEFYLNYVADDNLSSLSDKLIECINNENPAHALDFGCGSGKHSHILNTFGVSTIALDLSLANIIRSQAKYDLPCVMCCDEKYLRNLINIDVVFTCSVLDHVEDITGIISEFKRIANKAIYLAETNDTPSGHYFYHSYESFGFTKLDFEWKSEGKDGDGCVYNIWELKK